MGGLGDLTRTIADGIAGLVGGAVRAIGDGISTFIADGQQVLPGPWFFVVLAGLFVLLLLFTFRK